MDDTDRPTIMVVEDDVEMNELERELLALHGCDAVAAYTGPEALELRQQRRPDAVLLDLMLPDLDGFQTCARLRERDNGRRLPIVIVSALDTEDSRQRGAEAGADAYFAKPFDPDEVIQKIRSLMGQGDH